MPQPPAWKTPASWHGRPAMHSESHELETNVWQERQLLQVRRTFYIGLPTRLKSPKPCLDISGHCFSVRSRLTVLATPQIGSSQVEKELSMLHSNVGFRSARHAEKKNGGEQPRQAQTMPPICIVGTVFSFPRGQLQLHPVPLRLLLLLLPNWPGGLGLLWFVERQNSR